MIHIPIRKLPKGRYVVIDSCYLAQDMVDYDRSMASKATYRDNKLVRHLLYKRAGGALHCFFGSNGLRGVSGVDLVGERAQGENMTIHIEAPCDAGHHVLVDGEKYPEVMNWLPQDQDLFQVINVEEDIPCPALYGHLPDFAKRAMQKRWAWRWQGMLKVVNRLIGITAGLAGGILLAKGKIKEGLLGMVTALRCLVFTPHTPEVPNIWLNFVTVSIWIWLVLG